jgi:hypothetical protein
MPSYATQEQRHTLLQFADQLFVCPALVGGQVVHLESTERVLLCRGANTA